MQRGYIRGARLAFPRVEESTSGGPLLLPRAHGRRRRGRGAPDVLLQPHERGPFGAVCQGQVGALGGAPHSGAITPERDAVHGGMLPEQREYTLVLRQLIAVL